MDILWNQITKEELSSLYYDKELSDRQIADLFHISKNKVAYKRKRYGISFRNKVFRDFQEKNSDLFAKLNSDSKEKLLNRENIEMLSKMITHFAFRNGPVEDMHANNQLSLEDMKILNKYMVNRIAGLLTAIADNNWLQLELLLAYYRDYGTDWDKVEPDMEEISLVLKNVIENGI